MVIRNIQIPKSISLIILICISLVFIGMATNSKSNQMPLTSISYLQQPPTPTPQPNCPVPPYPAAAYGQQPYPDEIAPYFDQASLNQLKSTAPTLPTIDNASPYTPCILLKAIGYQESGWQHFDTNFSNHGYTKIGPSCDYGLMQIVSGMDGSHSNFEASRANEEIPYNIGTGTLLLIEKWKTLKLNSGGFDGGPYIVGDGSIKIVEDWYYSVWAYNSWGWINNPNNR